MEILRDLYYTNRSIIKKAFFSLFKNWPIVFTGIFYLIATIIVYQILPYFWILAFLILILFVNALVSNYLYLLNCIISRNRITFKDFKDGFTVYLRKLWGISFIGYLIFLILNTILSLFIGRSVYPGAIRNIIFILVLIAFNALPEVVYQKYDYAWESILGAWNFIKENWIEWFLPNLLLWVMWYWVQDDVLWGTLNFNSYYLRRIFLSWRTLLLYLLGQVWFSYLMIYRGYLFEILSKSSRRKRLFMREL